MDDPYDFGRIAATNALSRVQVKDLTRTDPPASIALSFGLLSTLLGAASIVLGWVPLDGQTLEFSAQVQQRVAV